MRREKREECQLFIIQVDTDLRMVDKQLEVLRTFPIHPKRSTYEKELVEEQEKLRKVQANFSSKLTEFKYKTTPFLSRLFFLLTSYTGDCTTGVWESLMSRDGWRQDWMIIVLIS